MSQIPDNKPSQDELLRLFGQEMRKQYGQEALRRIWPWQVLGSIMAVCGLGMGVFAGYKAVSLFALLGKEGINSGAALAFGLGFGVAGWLLISSAVMGVIGVRRAEELKRKIRAELADAAKQGAEEKDPGSEPSARP